SVDRGKLYCLLRKHAGFRVVGLYNNFVFAAFVAHAHAADCLRWCRTLPHGISSELAKQSYAVPYPQPEDDPANLGIVDTIHLTHLPPNYTQEEMTSMCAWLDGFESIQFHGKYLYVKFRSADQAALAREILRRETNLVVTFSHAKRAPPPGTMVPIILPDDVTLAAAAAAGIGMPSLSPSMRSIYMPSYRPSKTPLLPSMAQGVAIKQLSQSLDLGAAGAGGLGGPYGMRRMAPGAVPTGLSHLSLHPNHRYSTSPVQDAFAQPTPARHPLVAQAMAQHLQYHSSLVGGFGAGGLLSRPASPCSSIGSVPDDASSLYRSASPPSRTLSPDAAPWFPSSFLGASDMSLDASATTGAFKGLRRAATAPVPGHGPSSHLGASAGGLSDEGLVPSSIRRDWGSPLVSSLLSSVAPVAPAAEEDGSWTRTPRRPAAAATWGGLWASSATAAGSAASTSEVSAAVSSQTSSFGGSQADGDACVDDDYAMQDADGIAAAELMVAALAGGGWGATAAAAAPAVSAAFATMPIGASPTRTTTTAVPAMPSSPEDILICAGPGADDATAPADDDDDEAAATARDTAVRLGLYQSPYAADHPSLFSFSIGSGAGSGCGMAGSGIMVGGSPVQVLHEAFGVVPSEAATEV
ncbi:hypothetical protein HK405_008601, partial [Cladochytrium tenue]